MFAEKVPDSPLYDFPLPSNTPTDTILCFSLPLSRSPRLPFHSFVLYHAQQTNTTEHMSTHTLFYSLHFTMFFFLVLSHTSLSLILRSIGCKRSTNDCHYSTLCSCSQFIYLLSHSHSIESYQRNRVCLGK